MFLYLRVNVLGCGGCRPSDYEPSTQAEAQKIYSQTKWFFAPQLAFSRRVRDPDADTPPDSRNQTFFKLASGTHIIYSEYLPNSGIKAFHGSGRLEPLPELAGPIYRLQQCLHGRTSRRRHGSRLPRRPQVSGAGAGDKPANRFGGRPRSGHQRPGQSAQPGTPSLA